MILVALPALAVAGVSLAGFFGAWWWPLDLLANFRPQYAVALAVGALALAVGRWWRTATLVALVGLVNLALVAPLYLLPEPAGAVTGESLRVLSFNLFAENDSYQPVIEYIRQTQPDVVFLHESTELWEEQIEAADLPYQVVATQSEELIFGTLVLAPPEAEVEGFGFRESEPRAVEVQLTLANGTPVSLLGVHALSPDTERRALLRDAQLRYAGESWASEQEGRAVIVGDFNATPWSHAFRRLQRLSGFHNSQRGFGIQASFPATSHPAIRVPIDHLLYSDGLIVLDRQLGPRMGSDHFPLLVDLSVTS